MGQNCIDDKSLKKYFSSSTLKKIFYFGIDDGSSENLQVSGLVIGLKQ